MRRRLSGLRLILPLALIAIGGLLALAIQQETAVGSLKGRVVAQESGNPLVATIRLISLDEEREYDTKSAKDGSFSLMNIPGGDYALSMYSKAHALGPVSLTIEESRIKTVEAEMAPKNSNLSLYIHQHIFTPGEQPRFTCSGFVQDANLELKVYSVDLDIFITVGSIEKMLGIESYYGGNRPVVDLDKRQWFKPVESTNVPITTRDIEGMFVQRVDLPVLKPGLYLAAIKADGIQRLGWIMVTSLGLITKSVGSEILAYAVDLKTGSPIAGAEVALYSGADLLGSGKTGVDGIVTFSHPPTKGESHETVIAHSGNSTAFVSHYAYSSEKPSNVIYAYTDRPVYRPGQLVHFKGIVRQTTSTGYKAPASKPVTVEIRDSRETLIQRSKLKTDDFGCYHGDIALNSEAATGYYTVNSSVDGQRNEPIYFQVAAYRKPEFSVKIDFPRKRYVRGERVKAKMSAGYYFGAPLANAEVTYSVSYAPYWLYPMDEEDIADYYGGDGGYEDYGGYGEFAFEAKVRTDSNGEATIEFPANWAQPAEEYYDSDRLFTIDAYVKDKSGREANGSGSVVVTRGEFDLQVTPDRYVVQPGEQSNVVIYAVDYDRHPVKGQRVEVLVGVENWKPNGESTFEELQKKRLTTDDAGRASISVSPERAGDIHVIVKARDQKGNRIVSSAYVWSYSGEYEEENRPYPELKIVTDKKTYNIGDTAKVLINTSHPGATALLTVEGSRVYDHKLVKLTGKSTLVEIPVRSEYKPNFYVGVCFVRDKEFVNQQVRAKVSLNLQALKVQVRPNKEKYRPGELATYDVTAADSHGNPADAQLSVGVVDEAIYAIQEENTPPMLDYFYSHKENEVETGFSFPQIYLSDPDKAGKPDMSLLARNIRIRKRFLDTAFWDASVRTGPDGEAQVSFRMPDNLTTWRTTVRGITMDTSCGETRSKVLAQQDFLVRLETPRFMVQTDNATITAMVHNYTGTTQQAEIELKCPGLELQGHSRQKVTVADGGAERVDWRVSAPKAGYFDVTARAASRSASDAMQVVLPVYPHGTAREFVQTGELGKTATSKTNMQVRNDSIPGFSRVVVRLAPSMAAAMLGSLDYLAQYPYGCIEQTTSSFLPDVILSQSLKDLGVRNRKLEAKLPDMVAKGLARLYRFQLEDGGWGWSEYGKSDPWMTAYVCYGLVQAKDAGFAVNQDILRSGLSQLRTQLENEEDPNREAFGWYVLTLAGNNTSPQLARVMTQQINSEALAYVTLGYAQLGMRKEAENALQRLLGNAVSETGTIHWKGIGVYGSEDVEATALALQALLKVSPDDPRVYQIVRWVMSQRQGDYWYSTRGTAMVLYAMAEFLKSTKELTPNSDVQVLMNGRLVGRVHFDKDSLFNPEVVISATNLNKGRNSLEIRKKGIGNVYYSAKLSQYIAQKFIPATITGTGLTITRQYYRLPSRNSEQKDLGRPVSGCRFDDIIAVRVEVTAENPVSHVMVEDFIPAGCEILDRGSVSPWEWYDWWTGQDVRDEKISFYVDELPAGKHVLKYQMRAGFLGSYHALPAQVFAMYEPKVRASSGESEFAIR